MTKLLLIILIFAAIYFTLGILILHVRDTIRLRLKMRELRRKSTNRLKARLSH